MQPLAPAPPGHLAPGELVHDHHLAIRLDDVLLVQVVDRLRLEGVLQVVDQVVVAVVVERGPVGQAEHLLDPVDALVGHLDRLALLVDLEVAPLAQLLGELGELVVAVGRLLGRAGDDQRGARLVDQDVVDLVHDGEVERPLHRLGDVHHHVVAQVVEAELVIRAVEDVGLVGLAALDRPPVVQALVAVRRRVLERGIVDPGELVADHADGDPERVVDRPHPAAAETREVVVRRDEVDPAPGERVEVEGQRGDQGLPLARPHLGDLAAVEDHAAHQLHVEVALAVGALAGLARRGEGLGQQVVERLALGQALPELLRLGAQLLVAQLLELRLQPVDDLDLPANGPQRAVGAIAEDSTEELTHGSASPVGGGARPAASFLLRSG